MASSSSGPSGNSSTRSCHVANGSFSRWTARNRGEFSTRCSRSAPANAGATRATARSASAISVPRPGPASASTTGDGAPIARHVTAAHAPSNSPNTWEISGAVVKSANGSRSA